LNNGEKDSQHLFILFFLILIIYLTKCCRLISTINSECVNPALKTKPKTKQQHNHLFKVPGLYNFTVDTRECPFEGNKGQDDKRKHAI
jgi:hypothetical protein